MGLFKALLDTNKCRTAHAVIQTEYGTIVTRGSVLWNLIVVWAADCPSNNANKFDIAPVVISSYVEMGQVKGVEPIISENIARWAKVAISHRSRRMFKSSASVSTVDAIVQRSKGLTLKDYKSPDEVSTVNQFKREFYGEYFPELSLN